MEVPAQADILKPEEARARLQRGDPLLSLQELDIDADQADGPGDADRLRHRRAAARARQASSPTSTPGCTAAATGCGRWQSPICSGNGIPESNSGIDGGLLAFVMHNALHPFLRAQAESLGRFVDASSWYRGYCPICGGEPDMAALEKSGGRRRLLCSRCDAEWAYRRLGCPFCGNDEPKELAFFPSDDKVYRLAVCERCRRYLKTVDLRETGGASAGGGARSHGGHGRRGAGDGLPRAGLSLARASASLPLVDAKQLVRPHRPRSSAPADLLNAG